MLETGLNTLPARLPARPRDCHKGDYGSVGILGGAPGMAGAAVLAGRAALACGAGRVYLGVLDERIALDPATPELMIRTADNLPQLPHPACLVVGPGLGQSTPARRCLQDALLVEHALLLDADALNLVARDADLLSLLRNRSAPSLLTPHPGEAARLLGQHIGSLQADRERALHGLAELTGATIVLKGAGSLVYHPGGTVWRNTSGNPGMAAPGMGDVLAGLIAALLAQGMNPEQAAVVGVWLHGAAADEAVATGHGPVGLMASEVILAARRILNEISGGSAPE